MIIIIFKILIDLVFRASSSVAFHSNLPRFCFSLVWTPSAWKSYGVPKQLGLLLWDGTMLLLQILSPNALIFLKHLVKWVPEFQMSRGLMAVLMKRCPVVEQRSLCSIQGKAGEGNGSWRLRVNLPGFP